jgi:Flp pilus assembly protein TadD
MMDTEAFREFKTGLTFLRDNYANRAFEHIKRAADMEKNNPYYMSYLGVALARTQQKWADAERLCDTAVRMKRNQAQLYLNLAEVSMAKLTPRRLPVFTFLERKHPLNRHFGLLRHKALQAFGRG